MRSPDVAGLADVGQGRRHDFGRQALGVAGPIVADATVGIEAGVAQLTLGRVHCHGNHPLCEHCPAVPVNVDLGNLQAREALGPRLTFWPPFAPLHGELAGPPAVLGAVRALLDLTIAACPLHHRVAE